MNARHHRLGVAWIALALSLLLLAGCAARASRDDIRAALREEPDLVLDVLRQHPEELIGILSDAAESREERQQAARLQKELAHPLEPDLSGGRLFQGAADAPVAMVVYSDFLCGYCAAVTRTVHELLAKHPGQIRFVFKHFPHSRTSAEMALYFEALGRQNPALAWRFHDEVFARQRELAKDPDALAALVAGLAPDQDRLDSDLHDPALAQRLSDDSREASRFGFDGTPSFVIGGVSLVGSQPLDKFEEVLGLVLKKKAPATSGEWMPAGETACADCLKN
jgi:protein-disulfide isomerase